jgi:hypothetical protein
MAKLGGRISMRLSTGLLISMRGGMTIMPSGQSNEIITNQDSTISVVATPMARRFEMTFEDRGIDYDALMKADAFNVTFVEEFTGVTHYFTDAYMVGDPSINRGTGEVSGLSGAAQAYSRTGA